MVYVSYSCAPSDAPWDVPTTSESRLGSGSPTTDLQRAVKGMNPLCLDFPKERGGEKTPQSLVVNSPLPLPPYLLDPRETSRLGPRGGGRPPTTPVRHDEPLAQTRAVPGTWTEESPTVSGTSLRLRGDRWAPHTGKGTVEVRTRGSHRRAGEVASRYPELPQECHQLSDRPRESRDKE